ncbi:splicing factor [Aphelenchoides avenae]|nr:splicing factor [Aphelenchus avenae]
MDSDVIQAFSKSLMSIQENKGAVSKQKITEATKAALTAIRYYKHVVFVLEKFLLKCRAEHKVPGFYLIDSILRRAKKEYKHKDVFAPRFAVNMSNTIANALVCDQDDRLKIVRVLNLWLSNHIYDEGTVEPWLQFCRARGLEVDLEAVEKKVKGEKANMSIYAADAQPPAGGRQQAKAVPRTPPMDAPRSGPVPRTPPLELRPATPASQVYNLSTEDVSGSDKLSEREVLEIVSAQDAEWASTFGNNHEMLSRVHRLLNERVTEKVEIESRRQGNIKNLLSRDFEYSDEEDEDEPKQRTEPPQALTKEALLSLAQAALADPSVREEVDNISRGTSGRGADRRSSNGPVQGVPPPMPVNFAVPPPGFPAFSPSVPPPTLGSAVQQQFSKSNGSSGDPRDRSGRDRRDRRREKSRSPDRSDPRQRRDDPRRRSRSRDRDRDRPNKDRDRSHQRASEAAEPSSRRARSPSPRRRKDREGDRGRDRDGEDRERSRNPEKDKEREKWEKERKKLGLPTKPKEEHLLIASRTLWFGRLPANCTENDIREAVKDAAGEPEHVNIIPSRACGYVTMTDRRSAFKIMDKLAKDLQVMKKTVKVDWAAGQGLKSDEKLMDYWDSERGLSQIPHSKLPDALDALLVGSWLDTSSLPPALQGQYNEKARNILPPQPMFAQMPMFMPPHMFPVQSSVPQASVSGSTDASAIPAPQMLPPGMQLIPGFPPGIPLPPGMQFPPGMQLPPQLLMQQQAALAAAAAAGMAAGNVPLPPGTQPPVAENPLSGAPLQAVDSATSDEASMKALEGIVAGDVDVVASGTIRRHGEVAAEASPSKGIEAADHPGDSAVIRSREKDRRSTTEVDSHAHTLRAYPTKNRDMPKSKDPTTDSATRASAVPGLVVAAAAAALADPNRVAASAEVFAEDAAEGGRYWEDLNRASEIGEEDTADGAAAFVANTEERTHPRGEADTNNDHRLPPVHHRRRTLEASITTASRESHSPFERSGPPKKQSRFEPIDEAASRQAAENLSENKFGEPPTSEALAVESQQPSCNLREIPLKDDSEPSSTNEQSSDHREAVTSTTTTDEPPRFEEADSLVKDEPPSESAHFAAAPEKHEPTSTSNDDLLVGGQGGAEEPAAE